MYTSLLAATLFATSNLLTFTTAIPFNQPATRAVDCSWDSPLPCACPSGTYFNQSTTTALIGAPVANVSSIMRPFFNTSWLGEMPISTSGTDGTPSARRTLLFQTPDGKIVDIVEGIHNMTDDGKGGFKLQFYVVNTPVEYAGGTLSGDWDTLQIQSTGVNQTRVDWSIYSCFTGYSSTFDCIPLIEIGLLS